MKLRLCGKGKDCCWNNCVQNSIDVPDIKSGMYEEDVAVIGFAQQYIYAKIEIATDGIPNN